MFSRIPCRTEIALRFPFVIPAFVSCKRFGRTSRQARLVTRVWTRTKSLPFLFLNYIYRNVGALTGNILFYVWKLESFPSREEREGGGGRGRTERVLFRGWRFFFWIFFLFFFENREFLSEFVIDVQIIMIEKLLLLLLSGSIIRGLRFRYRAHPWVPCLSIVNFTT